jgi:hypothetical protein
LETKHDVEFPAEGVRVDSVFFVEGGRVVWFSINVSAWFKGEAHDVYRVDTAHGRLHEQKFWQSGEPEWLEEEGKEDYSREFAWFRRAVKDNCLRWLFKERWKNEG